MGQNLVKLFFPVANLISQTDYKIPIHLLHSLVKNCHLYKQKSPDLLPSVSPLFDFIPKTIKYFILDYLSPGSSGTSNKFIEQVYCLVLKDLDESQVRTFIIRITVTDGFRSDFVNIKMDVREK